MNGFVATSGSSYMSTKTAFTYATWEKDEITFELAEATEGYIQVGGQAISGGSGSNAKVFFDNVTLDDLTASAVQSYVVQGKTNPDWINYKAGDCFIFKTGPLSTYPNSTGIVRFERIEGSRDSFTGQNALPNDKPCYIVISIKTQVVE
jgi:hypothetical protein